MLARDEIDASGSRDNDALIGDRFSDQAYVATRCRFYASLIDDTAFRALERLELVVARHEVVDADLHRACNQTPHINFGARFEKHTVGIQEHNLAVRFDPAKDLARSLIKDAV